MFVVIWAALLSSGRGSNADTGVSTRTYPTCSNGFCITLDEGTITSEAGLCVVVPCSFFTPYTFTPQHLVWYKCEHTKRKCSDSDVIFHTNTNSGKIQPEFKGRVLLLESNLFQRNCSIMINNLTVSDSGSYQLRVNGLLDWRRSDGFTFAQRASVMIKDLSQRPVVTVPPLTEGQQTTLTCTAPGLCSGSAPTISWMWRTTAQDDSDLTRNITSFMTRNTVTQQYTSSLTFTPSAGLHGTGVSCKVSFSGDVTAEETVTLNVTYVKEINITGETTITEGETLNLTCSVESFPQSFITWAEYSDDDEENELQNNTGMFTQEESERATLFVANVTAENTGQYICTAKHLNNTLIRVVNITVKYMRPPQISGDTTVKEGGGLNLTCSVESFPPSLLMWTVLGSDTNPGTRLDLRNDTGGHSLFIANVTKEHSGRYICIAEHQITTLTTYVDVTVTWYSKILNGSGCVVEASFLTCVCVSQGVPLPSIKWPVLEKHTNYHLITTVTNYTVNSTVFLTVKDLGRAAVQCVSSHGDGDEKENLNIQIQTSKPDQAGELMKKVSWVEMSIAFLIGVILSSVLCFLTKKCDRKKQNTLGDLGETLEMQMEQEQLVYAEEDRKDDETHQQDKDEVKDVAGKDLDIGPKDVEYASLDFSLLKRKGPMEAANIQETTETEYAEIKQELKNNEDSKGEDEETKCSVQEEDGEDMALYSNLKNCDI